MHFWIHVTSYDLVYTTYSCCAETESVNIYPHSVYLPLSVSLVNTHTDHVQMHIHVPRDTKRARANVVQNYRMVQESGSWEAAMERLHEQVMAHPVAAGSVGADMRATYHCTMTLAYPTGKKVTVTDTLSGKLVWPPRGDVTEGSGFYSMFVAEGESQTLQEMNLAAFDAMANSNHRFGAFEETVKAMFREDMVTSKILHNPFTAYKNKHKNSQEPESLTPLQDIFEYVRPPGTEIVNNEYIKPYINSNSQHLMFPQVCPTFICRVCIF